MDQVDDEDLLYRRVALTKPFYDPDHRMLTADAFKPDKNRDIDGLSMSRARSNEHPDFRTIEQISRGPSMNGYVVVELRAGDIRAAGMRVIANRLDDDPGHVLLPDLNSRNYKSVEVAEWKQRLRTLVRRQIDPEQSTS